MLLIFQCVYTNDARPVTCVSLGKASQGHLRNKKAEEYWIPLLDDHVVHGIRPQTQKRLGRDRSRWLSDNRQLLYLLNHVVLQGPTTSESHYVLRHWVDSQAFIASLTLAELLMPKQEQRYTMLQPAQVFRYCSLGGGRVMRGEPGCYKQDSLFPDIILLKLHQRIWQLSGPFIHTSCACTKFIHSSCCCFLITG